VGKNQPAVRKNSLQDLLFSYTLLAAGHVRYLVREVKINPYYDTTFYVNGSKVTLVLV
jgi:hypothetical protein